MITYNKISHGLTEGRKEINYEPAHEVFQQIYQKHRYKFLFESKDVSPIYGRLSLIGVDPVLKISGKDDSFSIEKLNSRGSFYFQSLTNSDFEICDSLNFKPQNISGKVLREQGTFEETERSKRKNISQIPRLFLEKFKQGKRCLLGLYGPFSYDFVRLFEDLENHLPSSEVNDFDLFLYDTFIFFDHLKERAEIISFGESKAQIAESMTTLEEQLGPKKVLMNLKTTNPKTEYSITNAQFSLSQPQYEKLVEKAQQYTKEGELFEVVFSNTLKAHFKGDAFGLYLKYREVNPSPYLFYFDLGADQLVGASPEMMVRVENNIAHIRPISGTARRGGDPIEDHENMVALLADKKERAELDMLIDLGRNDLSRICKPGLAISDYRFVEKYSRVMHTVAHISGELKDGFTAFDALIACLNAGTLTGAPKVAAMNAIERHEKERREYYGGTIGYLTFSGEMDSAIIIRTAHISGDRLRFQVGATLLYKSIPAHEYQETLNKAEAFLATFANRERSAVLSTNPQALS